MRQGLIPTSRDIYIEIEGRKIAMVESYRVSSKRELYPIEEFGSARPVKTVSGTEQHRLELKRIYLADETCTDFFSLADFTLVVVKPDCRIVYTGCTWEQISESVGLGEPCIETMTALAERRVVL